MLPTLIFVPARIVAVRPADPSDETAAWTALSIVIARAAPASPPLQYLALCLLKRQQNGVESFAFEFAVGIPMPQMPDQALLENLSALRIEGGAHVSLNGSVQADAPLTERIVLARTRAADLSRLEVPDDRPIVEVRKVS